MKVRLVSQRDKHAKLIELLLPGNRIVKVRAEPDIQLELLLPEKVAQTIKLFKKIMDVQTAKLIATAFAIGVGVIGPGIAVGLIGAAAAQAIGRNPEATPKIRTNMILAIAFAEAIAIYALLIALIIKFV